MTHGPVSKVALREATIDDLPVIVAIERASFSDAWSRPMFLAHLRARATDLFMVAQVNGVVVGYAIVRVVGGQSEILNIAVSNSARRGGAGSALLDAAVERATEAGAPEMWLEVRESNDAARALYARKGFEIVGRRPRYYETPVEDALVMKRVASAHGNESMKAGEAGFGGAAAGQILSTALVEPRQENE